MKRATDVLCACGAPMDEIDTDLGMEAACPECGLREQWPEHLDLPTR